MTDERIELRGRTMFIRNGEYAMFHQTNIEIQAGQVSTEITGEGEGCEQVAPVVSDHPAVEQYHRDVDRALAISAYRNRPIQTRFKPERKRRKR